MSLQSSNIQRLREAYFPTFVVMGNIIPVVLGSRKASSFFYDDNFALIEQININQILQLQDRTDRLAEQRKQLWALHGKGKTALAAGTIRKSRRELLEIQRALSDLPIIARYIDYSTSLGIIATPVPYSARDEVGIVPRIYFSREPIDSDRLIDLRVRKFRGGTPLEFEEYDGFIHGYPECCIKDYVRQSSNTVFSGFPMPKAKSVDEVPGFKAMLTDDVFRELGDGIYQFFVEEFFPCTYTNGTPCQKTIDTGKRVFSSLKTVVPEEAVRQFFATNYMLALEYTHGAGEPSYSISDSPNVGTYRLPFSFFLGL